MGFLALALYQLPFEVPYSVRRRSPARGGIGLGQETTRGWSLGTFAQRPERPLIRQLVLLA
jgi:hypothetical protein